MSPYPHPYCTQRVAQLLGVGRLLGAHPERAVGEPRRTRTAKAR